MSHKITNNQKENIILIIILYKKSIENRLIKLIER